MNLASAIELRDSETRPHSAPRPPEEVPLSMVADCMDAILATIRARGSSIRQTCRAVVDTKTFTAWRTLGREPKTDKFGALARAVGYEIVMIGPGVEIDATDQAAVIEALNAERQRRGLTIIDMDAEFGVPGRTWSYWRAGERPASLRPLVMLAECLGFQMVMRRAKKAPRPSAA